MIKAGDSVEADQSLITLESDKASMEIPAPKAGVVESLSIKVGDEAKTGDLILTLKVKGPAPAKKAEAKPQRSEEHTSELQSLMRISYAVFCLKKKIQH